MAELRREVVCTGGDDAVFKAIATAYKALTEAAAMRMRTMLLSLSRPVSPGVGLERLRPKKAAGGIWKDLARLSDSADVRTASSSSGQAVGPWQGHAPCLDPQAQASQMPVLDIMTSKAPTATKAGSQLAGACFVMLSECSGL